MTSQENRYPNRIRNILGPNLYWPNKKSQYTYPTKTKLGWVVGGRCDSTKPITRVNCGLSVTERVNDKSKTSRKLNEPPPTIYLTSEERSFDSYYKTHTTRTNDRRNIVKIPLREDTTSLVKSREMGERRFLQVQNRLYSYMNLKKQYTAYGRIPSCHMVRVGGIHNLHNLRFMLCKQKLYKHR